MRFGVREICDVVLKAKSIQKVGNKVFYKDEPVLYFDSLKTSSLEGAATTVYAQGGRGNSRLIAWEGERTITFTMEDALLSPAGFAILSGANLINASDEKKIQQHVTERTMTVEFITKNNAYEDYPVDDYVFFDNYIYTNDGWEEPHYPIEGVPYAYDIYEDDAEAEESELCFTKPICHVCEDENDEYNGTYMWFPEGTTIFSQQNAKAYFGPSTHISTENHDLVIIYLKQKPIINLVLDDISFSYQLTSPIYAMRVIDDEIVTEPFYADKVQVVANEDSPHYGEYRIFLKTTDDLNKGFLKLSTSSFFYEKVIFEGKTTKQGWDEPHYQDPTIEYYYKDGTQYIFNEKQPSCYRDQAASGPYYHKYFWAPDAGLEVPLSISSAKEYYAKIFNYELDDNIVVLLDYYTEKSAGYQIDITPDKFGGNYYLEASTLFRDQSGVDLPAEFIIPNCKIQSNFTFTMASSGDPSTFTFTMDAFPDYTRFDPTKKVLTSIQILDVASNSGLTNRIVDPWSLDDNSSDAAREKTWTGFEPANN